MPLSSLAALAGVLAVGYLIVIAAAVVSGALARGGRRDRALESDDVLAISRFTIPVSILVPVIDDGSSIVPLIRSLLALNYPEFEIVVVAEGRGVAAIAALREEWKLEPKEVFYRRTIDTAPVRRIYGSGREARMIVVEKAAGGRADALNCGASLARFRYLVSLPGDVRFDADALLRLMSPAIIDPGAVLAVTGAVERRGDDAGPAADFQTLASLRSWMAARLAWHQPRAGLPPRDSAVAWRRDAVLEAGGFAAGTADPEVDLLVRLQTSHARGSVVRTWAVFGRAGTLSLRAAARQAVRRRRALLEAFGLFWNRRGRAAGRLALAPTLVVELLTPLIELFVVALTVAGAAMGRLYWTAPALAILLVAFGQGMVSAAALLMRGASADAPAGAELRRLLLQAPLEFTIYRPALAWARFRGAGS
jgi:glycosyltransferase involved in cell wall biosynthesis